MTPEQAGSVVRVLEAGWPREMTPETALVYMDGIGDLPYDDAQRAVRWLVRVCEFRPSVAEIRREVAQQAGLLPPSLEEALGQARRWAEWRAQRAWSNGNGYESVQPATHDVVVKVCRGLSVDASDPTWVHVFRAAYKEAVVGEERRVLAGDGLLSLEVGE